MDILNSGSFVTLDNREKIDQLIYTARELATEVSRTEGFESSGQTNHQLGLEMWKGAEYLCRAHEEANIRNLFLSKFLERLREIDKQNNGSPKSAQPRIVELTPVRTPVEVQTQVVATPPTLHVLTAAPATSSLGIAQAPQQREAHDEYLGVISQASDNDNGRPSYADECKPEFERELAETHDGLELEESLIVARDPVGAEPKESISSASPQVEGPAVTNDAAVDVPGLGSTSEPTAEESNNAAPIPENATCVDSIVLSEKEPYNFDSCTVTAVIQLLPENGGFRKSVISVRSHDFAPQISIADIDNGDVHQGIRQCLETSMGQYRTSLPILAAEKLKKQKPTSKKRSAKTVDKDTKASSVSNAKTSEGSTAPPATQNSELGIDQRNLFAA